MGALPGGPRPPRAVTRTGADPEALAAELVTAMLRSGTTVLRDGRLHDAAEHTPVAPEALRVPHPRTWPAAEPR
ncbi:hypothetical protein ACWGRV_30940 [Streptomyces sp. NPDC055663]